MFVKLSSRPTCRAVVLGKRSAMRLSLTNSYVFSRNNVRHQTVGTSVLCMMEISASASHTTLRKRRILFAGFVARMEDTTLPKCVMFGELVGGAVSAGERKTSGWGVSWTTSELSVSRPTSEGSQLKMLKNGTKQ